MRSIKNIKKIYLIIPVLLILLTILINYSFFKPTKINSFIASTLYNTPANSYFDDDNFYQCIVDAYNEKNDTNLPYTTVLTDEQLMAITNLNFYGHGKPSEKIINSAKGIEKLTNLISLDFASNNIKEIDLSGNTKLKSLNLDGNNLSSIDLSKNINLTALYLGSNNISAIDVSNNINLTILNISHNDLSNIDVSKNTQLLTFAAAFNNLTNMDLSNNLLLENLNVLGNNLKILNISKSGSLISLDASGNQLTSLDINNNENLTQLKLENNQLTELNLSEIKGLKNVKIGNNKLNFIDIGKSTELVSLSINSNNLTNINLTNNINLSELKISSNQLTKLDISTNIMLSHLDVGYNQLTELDVSNNKELIKLIAIENKLTNLSIGNNSKLLELNVYDNNLQNLDVTHNTSLSILEAGENNLLELDISKNKELTELSLSDKSNYTQNEKNAITNIMLNNNIKLEKLDLAFNRLESIDLKNNIKLTSLNLHGNNLTEIDVSRNTLLTAIVVSYNQLTELDVSKNINLTNLTAGNYSNLGGYSKNKIPNVDVSNNKELTHLDLGSLGIKELDLRQNTKLVSLYLHGNELTTIDLSKCKDLVTIRIEDNKLNSLDISHMKKYQGSSFSYNNFNEELYVYKNSNFVVGYNLKFPEFMNINYEYSNSDDAIVNIGTNKSFTALNVGKTIITSSFSCGLYLNDKCTNTSVVNVVNIHSDKYIIDEERGYIFIGNEINEQEILNNISISDHNVNVEINLDNYKLYVKQSNNILKTFDLYSIYSDKYSFDKNYIYIGVEEFDINKIKTINCEYEVINDKLLIKNNDAILKEFDIKNISLGKLKFGKNSISIAEDIPYETFTSNITTSEGLSYKIFNNEEEVTSGNISIGMKLNVYLNNEIIDTYNITDEFIDLSLLNIDEDKKIIKENILGLTIKDFKDKISTSGNIIIADKNNKTLTDTDIIKTGAKVKIELSTETYEYTISLLGDVSGDGVIDITDISKSYQYFRKKITMTDCYIEAADVSNNDFKIEITDISKLYQYFRKRITSLE